MTEDREKYHKVVEETDDRFYVDVRVIIYKSELKNYENMDQCINALHDIIADELESR